MHTRIISEVNINPYSCQPPAGVFGSLGLLVLEDSFVCHTGIELTLQIQKDVGDKASLKEFKEKLAGDEQHHGAIRALREEVESFASLFPLPGLPDF